MYKKHLDIAKSILGEDIEDDLIKMEIFKPESKTIVQPEEIKVALQIVPRAILTLLLINLKPMEKGDNKKLDLGFLEADAFMQISKIGADNYSGKIVSKGQVVNEFISRSLPSVGLMIMTSFEVYNQEMLNEIKNDDLTDSQKQYVSDKNEQLQRMIDERLNLYRLVSDVVDSKLSQKQAIDMLVTQKLNERINPIFVESTEVRVEKETTRVEKGKNKLKELLDRQRQRHLEEQIEVSKNDVNCPDCQMTLIKKEANKLKLCLCYGDFMDKEIRINKKENGRYTLKFPKSFDLDNIEMLLDSLKDKRGK